MEKKMEKKNYTPAEELTYDEKAIILALEIRADMDEVGPRQVAKAIASFFRQELDDVASLNATLAHLGEVLKIKVLLLSEGLKVAAYAPTQKKIAVLLNMMQSCRGDTNRTITKIIIGSQKKISPEHEQWLLSGVGLVGAAGPAGPAGPVSWKKCAGLGCEIMIEDDRDYCTDCSW